MPETLVKLPGKKTTHIFYANKPPRLGGQAQSIKIDDYAENNNFTWTDDLLAESALLKQHKALSDKPNYFKLITACRIHKFSFSLTLSTDDDTVGSISNKLDETTIKSELKKPKFQAEHNQTQMIRIQTELYIKQSNQVISDLVICDIDPKVGKGVFLKEGGAAIKKGTCVAIYTGVYQFDSQHLNPTYKILTSSHPMFLGSSFDGTGVIEASQWGGISRFIQSLPLESELSENFKFENYEQLKSVATANLVLKPMLYQNIPVMVLIANRDIKPGEQLGYSYNSTSNDLHRWAKIESVNGQKELLFDLQGKLLPVESYQHTKLSMWFPSNHFSICNVSNIISKLDTHNVTCIVDAIKGSTKVVNENEQFYTIYKKLLQNPPKPDTILGHLSLWFKFNVTLGNVTLTDREILIRQVVSVILKHHIENECKNDELSRQKTSYMRELLVVVQSMSYQAAIKKPKPFITAINQILDDEHKKDFYKQHLSELRTEISNIIHNYNKKYLQNKLVQESDEQQAGIADSSAPALTR